MRDLPGFCSCVIVDMFQGPLYLFRLKICEQSEKNEAISVTSFGDFSGLVIPERGWGWGISHPRVISGDGEREDLLYSGAERCAKTRWGWPRCHP
jgi:hypothetical protein